MSLLGDIAIGKHVLINESGNPHNFRIVEHIDDNGFGVQGQNIGSVYRGLNNKTLIMREFVLPARPWHSIQNNDYQISDIHQWLNSEYLNLLDDNIRNLIPAIRIPFRPGHGTSSVVNDGDNGLLCHAFIPSHSEVGYNNSIWNRTYPSIGMRFSSFPSANTGTPNPSLEALNDSGISSNWGLRTPSRSAAQNAYWEVRPDGTGNTILIMAAVPHRVMFALPSDLDVGDDDGGGGNMRAPLRNYNVGDIVHIRENNILTPFLVLHKGIPLNRINQYTGVDNDSVFLIRLRCENQTRRFNNNNTGQLPTNELPQYLNGEYLDKLECKDDVQFITMPYTQGNSSIGDIPQTDLHGYVFLPSWLQFFGSIPDFQYFLNIRNTGWIGGWDRHNPALVGTNDNGNVVDWWMYHVWNNLVSNFNTTGGSNNENRNIQRSVRPMFILRDEYEVEVVDNNKGVPLRDFNEGDVVYIREREISTPFIIINKGLINQFQELGSQHLGLDNNSITLMRLRCENQTRRFHSTNAAGTNLQNNEIFGYLNGNYANGLECVDSIKDVSMAHWRFLSPSVVERVWGRVFPVNFNTGYSYFQNHGGMGGGSWYAPRPRLVATNDNNVAVEYWNMDQSSNGNVERIMPNGSFSNHNRLNQQSVRPIFVLPDSYRVSEDLHRTTSRRLTRINTVMTSNTAPSPFSITANQEATNFPAWRAVDNMQRVVTPDGWMSTSNDAELVVDMSMPTEVAAYAITNRGFNDGSGNPSAAVDWTFCGSNNLIDWTVLHEVVDNQRIDFSVRTVYELSEIPIYRYYKIHVIETTSDVVAIGQFELLNWTPTIRVNPHMTSNTTPAPFIASSNNVTDGREPYRAFDGIINEAHSEFTSFSPSPPPYWLQLEMNEPTVIDGYLITNRVFPWFRGDSLPHAILNWELLGSFNGVDWTVLHIVRNSRFNNFNHQATHILPQQAEYRFYRLTSNNYFVIAELEFLIHEPPTVYPLRPRMTSNTAPSPFVASASTQLNNEHAAWMAFSYHMTPHPYGSLRNIDVNGFGNNWIQINFNESTTINYYDLTTRRSGGESVNWPPRDFTLMGSNNNIDWDVLDTQVDVPRGNVNTTERYYLPNEVTYHIYRLSVSRIHQSTNLNDRLLTIGQLEFGIIRRTPIVDIPLIDLEMTSNNTPAPYSASASSVGWGHEPYRAFSNALDASGNPTRWISDNSFSTPNRTGREWIQIDLGSWYMVNEFQMRALHYVDNHMPGLSAPMDFQLQGSHHGALWRTLSTQINQVWNPSETKMFDDLTISTYRMYRVVITRVNGPFQNVIISSIKFGLKPLNLFEYSETATIAPPLDAQDRLRIRNITYGHATPTELITLSQTPFYFLRDTFRVRREDDIPVYPIRPLMVSNTISQVFLNARASASTEFNTTTAGAWQAFNGIFTSHPTEGGWRTATNTFTDGIGNEWLQIDYGQQVIVSYYDVWSRMIEVVGNTQHPIDWSIRASNDNVTWWVIDIQRDIEFDSTQQKKRFELLGFVTARFFRMNITRAQAADRHVRIGQLEFGHIRPQGGVVNRPLVAVIPDMTSDNAPAPFRAFASTSYRTTPPWQAFAPTGAWASHAGSHTPGTGNSWIAIDTGASIVVRAIGMASDSSGSFTVRDFVLEGSNNGTNWVEIEQWFDTPPAFSGDSSGYAMFDVNTTESYSMYRLRITRIWLWGPAGGGGSRFVVVGRFQLYI